MVKAMQCTDKSVIPASLQYRDRGFMYFPLFIPFVRAVDQFVLQIANENEMRIFGKRLQLRRSELYVEILASKLDSLEGISTSVVDTVYFELLI